MSNETKPILMTAENPNGWKLEELLEKIAEELSERTDALDPNSCPVNPTIIRNNTFIFTRLLDCVSIQNHTMAALESSEFPAAIDLSTPTYQSPVLGRVKANKDSAESGVTVEPSNSFTGDSIKS